MRINVIFSELLFLPFPTPSSSLSGGLWGSTPSHGSSSPTPPRPHSAPPVPHKGPSVHHVQLSHEAPQIPEPGRISGVGGLGLGFGGQQLLKPRRGW